MPGFRVESLLATGNTPFYALPYVSLRGIPALRYQGELTILAKTEQAFNLTYRWRVVGFAGIVARLFRILTKWKPGIPPGMPVRVSGI